MFSASPQQRGRTEQEPPGLAEGNRVVGERIIGLVGNDDSIAEFTVPSGAAWSQHTARGEAPVA